MDPRLEGGKINQAARDAGDLVKLIELQGEQKLFYPSFPIHIAVIRATYADCHGNCTFEKEGAYAEALAQAQAAHNSGGKVIVQVEKVVSHGCLDARLVRIPGIYVDALVVGSPENHMQTFGTRYDPAFSGEVRIPLDALAPLPMGERKIIARRAAMELVPHAVTNLGIGMPEGVAAVAAEEGMEGMVLTTEVGGIGGVPAGGKDFGASTNVDCILEQPTQFDFYDGGGLDVAFLGLAQMDRSGNINVSKFGPKIAGCGGVINITQNAKKICFMGTFSSVKDTDIRLENGRLNIVKDSNVVKFVPEVEQITFSGDYARETGQGLTLVEVAPGAELERDIYPLMGFRPAVAADLKEMDPRIFRPEKMGLVLQD